ncbi:MAG: carboxymuconolactone decarboxylase family protein [Bdellovibrionales bacterium]|nr:carboxymuconolactone decarboxylase family protein [Bdellovibrionales bacterium]
MTIDNITNRLPEYAKDLKLNLSSVMRQTELSKDQLWGCMVAACMACRSPEVSKELLSAARSELAPEIFEAAKIAGALMGMNNIFYRFGHLASNDQYLKLPAGLRMNAIRSHGASKMDFELWSLVASAVNGCGLCIDSHEKALQEHGVSDAQILAAVRVGAVVHGIATVLDAESIVGD